MKRILLTQPIPEDVAARFAGEFEIVTAPDPSFEAVRACMGDCDGVLVRTATQMNAALIGCGEKLKVIGRTGVGVDNVDIAAATQRGIPVCNTPQANSVSVAEHALAMLLYFYKNLGGLDRAVKSGNWAMRDKAGASDVNGQTLALFGFGNIARHLANMADAMGMHIGFYDPFVAEGQAPRGIRQWDSLEAMVEDCDVLSLHAPLTKDTKGLFGRALLGRCKKDAVLINTSRGGLVEEAELLALLEAGYFRGVGLDVFEQEPVAAGHPLARFDRVLMTPHSAALTVQCRQRMAYDAMCGIADTLNGKRPQWVFNAEVFD